MCCITIGTDVLMANFFGSPNCGSFLANGAELEVVGKYAIALANNLPRYVFYDLSKKKVGEFIKENRDYMLHGEKIHYLGNGIDREHYNSIYHADIARKIESIADGFFRLHQYDKEIRTLMPVWA